MVCNKNGGICVFKRKSATLKISHFSSYLTINIPSWVFIDLGFIKCDIFFLVCKRILFDFIAYIYDSGSVQQPEEANAASGV